MWCRVKDVQSNVLNETFCNCIIWFDVCINSETEIRCHLHLRCKVEVWPRSIIVSIAHTYYRSSHTHRVAIQADPWAIIVHKPRVWCSLLHHCKLIMSANSVLKLCFTSVSDRPSICRINLLKVVCCVAYTAWEWLKVLITIVLFQCLKLVIKRVPGHKQCISWELWDIKVERNLQITGALFMN